MRTHLKHHLQTVLCDRNYIFTWEANKNRARQVAPPAQQWHTADVYRWSYGVSCIGGIVSVLLFVFCFCNDHDRWIYQRFLGQMCRVNVFTWIDLNHLNESMYGWLWAKKRTKRLVRMVCNVWHWSDECVRRLCWLEIFGKRIKKDSASKIRSGRWRLVDKLEWKRNMIQLACVHEFIFGKNVCINVFLEHSFSMNSFVMFLIYFR